MAATGPLSGNDATIRRAFDLPSPSELFDRARSWFGGTPEADPNNPNNPYGPGNANSVGPQPEDQAGLLSDFAAQGQPQPASSAELVLRPRSMSALLRKGSSMSEANADLHDQSLAEALSPREWDQLVDLVVERIEERVRDELARRGRRFSPGVF